MIIKDVKAFQFFLIGKGYYTSKADGDYGPLTRVAVRQFQKDNNLIVDGIAGEATIIKALEQGFMKTEFPLKPDFKPLFTTAEKQRVFGKFSFEAGSDLRNPDDVRIKGTWEEDNIVLISIPQLVPINGGNVRCHRFIVNQIKKLFQDWENAGLMHYVLTWHGCFNARFIRGRYGVLSNHSWGTAFDINYDGNELGATPLFVGEKGSVRLLVELAHQNGFYWGGHFSRKDGMHFEAAFLK